MFSSYVYVLILVVVFIINDVILWTQSRDMDKNTLPRYYFMTIPSIWIVSLGIWISFIFMALLGAQQPEYIGMSSTSYIAMERFCSMLMLAIPSAQNMILCYWSLLYFDHNLKKLLVHFLLSTVIAFVTFMAGMFGCLILFSL